MSRRGGSAPTGTSPDAGTGAGTGGITAPTTHVLYVATGCHYQIVDLTKNSIAATVDACSVSCGASITGLAANATANRVYATWTGGPVAFFAAASGALHAAGRVLRRRPFEPLRIRRVPGRRPPQEIGQGFGRSARSILAAKMRAWQELEKDQKLAADVAHLIEWLTS